MEYLNNKVTAMCDQLRCTKSLCHDSLAMSQILSAVVDGQEEQFPADNPIHLSNLETLLDNMHIENRTYKIKNQAERDDCLNSEEEGLGDQKEVKKSFRVQSKGGRKKSDSDFPRGQPFVASPSFHESRSFTSPSVSGSTSLRSQEVVTPGYLGDGEESASPVGTASCTKSLSLSNSSDDISDDGSTDDAAISSAATIVLQRGDLMNTREYSSSTKHDTSKKLLLLTDKSVSKEIQQQRVHYLVDAEQFASIRKCQVADGGSSSAADNVTTTAGFPQLLLIPTTITKLLQIVPAQSSAQNIKVTTESPEKGTRLVERSPRGKENRPESMTDQNGKQEDGMDQTSMSSSPVKASCDGQPLNMKVWTDAPGDDQHMETDGYNLFSKINSPHFHQAWPHLDGSDVTNLVSQAWKDLPEEIRNVYSEKASDWLPDEQQKQAKHTSKQ
ncbi:hypothetical protein BSL78_24033 [Apostichopus japonicus]|uniref:HMG box domain-containing protein n=1 Tax=Stichopus japonicus TaxID=307972 RepID=A0A2G8JTS6_STIJA|nr:hypothetical protein BSL78_24033 [Apostichopus japonicus]